MVWEVDARRRPDCPVAPAALHTLTGHDDAVTCVAASPMLDLVVSASQVAHLGNARAGGETGPWVC